MVEPPIRARRLTVETGPVAGQAQVDTRERSPRQLRARQGARLQFENIAEVVRGVWPPVALVHLQLLRVDVIRKDHAEAGPFETHASQADTREEFECTEFAGHLAPRIMFVTLSAAAPASARMSVSQKRTTRQPADSRSPVTLLSRAIVREILPTQ